MTESLEVAELMAIFLKVKDKMKKKEKKEMISSFKIALIKHGQSFANCGNPATLFQLLLI